MSIRLFHQCGHCTTWNVSSLAEDSCGSGLILSPVHSDADNISKIKENLRKVSLFDPQFYLPSSQKTKLASYEFFPETISGGFSTVDFHAHALDAARKCISFQVANKFSAVIVPSRYLDQMYSDYVERQNAYTVHPFVEVLEKEGVKAAYLTVVLTDHMIKDKGFRTYILNWITSFPVITGLYLIPDCKRSTKQVQDSDFLLELLKLVGEMRGVGLDVLVGYLNTENLLVSLVPKVDIAFGAFENTRIFTIDKFLEIEEDRRGPKARIYIPGLLNWILFAQAKEIRAKVPAVWKEIYVPTDESEKALALAAEPSFNQPALYKHHFKCVQGQISELAELDAPGRIGWLKEKTKRAQAAYSTIAKSVELERHGNGDHLKAWESAITSFAKLA
jgi:hypothetical protein